MWYTSNHRYHIAIRRMTSSPDRARLVFDSASTHSIYTQTSGVCTSRLESHLRAERVPYTARSFSDSLTPVVLSVAARGPPCAMFQLGCSSPVPSASEATPLVSEDLLLRMKCLPLSTSFLKLRAFSSGLLPCVAINKTPQAVPTSPNRRGGGKRSVGRSGWLAAAGRFADSIHT